MYKKRIPYRKKNLLKKITIHNIIWTSSYWVLWFWVLLYYFLLSLMSLKWGHYVIWVVLRLAHNFHTIIHNLRLKKKQLESIYTLYLIKVVLFWFELGLRLELKVDFWASRYILFSQTTLLTDRWPIISTFKVF